MNKEYKEKLETLQGIDFCNCLKEYIEHNEKLENENKRLHDVIDDTYENAEITKHELQTQLIEVLANETKLEIKNRELNNKIDEAIKYIKTLISDEYGVSICDGNNFIVYEPDWQEKLLEILKDSDVDE